jgi:hypothetical protein
MKKTLFIVMMAIGLTSCYNRIGSLTVVATRNVDPDGEYVQLRRNVTGDSRINRGQALQEAIEEAVKSVPGGEYMTNCVVYVRGNKVIRVTGDVHGLKEYQPQMKETEFAVGDDVIWLDDKNRRVKARVIAVTSSYIHIALIHNSKPFQTQPDRLTKIEN